MGCNCHKAQTNFKNLVTKGMSQPQPPQPPPPPMTRAERMRLRAIRVAQRNAAILAAQAAKEAEAKRNLGNQ